jgi:hypothetical protein
LLGRVRGELVLERKPDQGAAKDVADEVCEGETDDSRLSQCVD